MNDKQIKEIITKLSWDYPFMTLGDSIKFCLFNHGFHFNKKDLTYLKETIEEMINNLNE